ncbi:MAG: alpha/beta hydrolase-fold protein [Chloroflexota bacterium]|nr:alpha/beta hydrolase-fold protein [Chloroflexota bacterium]
MTGWREYETVHGRYHTVSGRVVVWPELAGAAGIRARQIMVYLPPSLARTWKATAPPTSRARGRRYPVLYFHDGQNVFDERTSYVGEWRADETLEQLATEGIEAIAVAVPNSREARMDEYNPWRSRERWHGRRVGGKGDAYLDWLVGSVKPLVDRSFPVDGRREATGIVGSSMGGLISLYALLAQPHVFSLAGVMSPSIGWSDYRILRLIDERGLPAVRIHLDMGGREWRGMTADARRLRAVLIAKGLVEGRDLHYVEERYAPHRESAWARRLPDALHFLLAAVDSR